MDQWDVKDARSSRQSHRPSLVDLKDQIRLAFCLVDERVSGCRYNHIRTRLLNCRHDPVRRSCKVDDGSPYRNDLKTPCGCSLNEGANDLPILPGDNDPHALQAALNGLEQTEPVARIPLAQRPPPPVIVEVPLDGLLDPRIEIFLSAPTKLGLEFGCVDRVASVVSWPVDNELNQPFTRMARGR